MSDPSGGPSDTDGVVTVRRPEASETNALVAARDHESHRFLGEVTAETALAAIVLDRDGALVGWVDYDVDREWLEEGEVNIGYGTSAAFRRLGYATRAVRLLLRFLEQDPEITMATLLIDPANSPSLGVARSTGFSCHSEINGQLLFKRSLSGA